MSQGLTKDQLIGHLSKTWKAYLVGIWMIAVSGFLLYLNGQIQAVNQVNVKLTSDVDSIESILIGTDGNVAEVKKKVDVMSGRMENVYRRVMRRR